MKIKHCKDCVHSRQDDLEDDATKVWDFARCNHKLAAIPGKYHLGEDTSRSHYCENMRTAPTKCGKEAKWFEARKSQ